MILAAYERVALARDFNAHVGENSFDTFLCQYNLISINRYPTCYKNPNNPICKDHILTNSQKSFFKTETVFTGYQTFINWFYLYLSYNFQKRRLRRYHTGILQISKRIIFNLDLQNRFSAEPIKEYAPFEKVFLDVLNRHALLKKNVVHANHAPYKAKTLRKPIMKGSYLERVYFMKKNSRFINKI